MTSDEEIRRLVKARQAALVEARPRRPFVIALGITSLLFALGIAALCLIPRWYATRDASDHIVQVTVVHDAIKQHIAVVVFGCFIAMLILIVAVEQKTVRWWAVALGVAAFLLGGFAILATCIVPPLGREDDVALPDGTSCELRWLGDYDSGTLALVVPQSRRRFSHTYRVLTATDAGDTPVTVVLGPYDEPRARWGLWLGRRDLILVVKEAGRVYAAYDSRQGRTLSRYELTRVSPFVLVGAESQLHADDVKALRDAVRSGDGPVPAALRSGLDHPNPAVRRLAQELLAIRAVASRPTASLPVTQGSPGE